MNQRIAKMAAVAAVLSMPGVSGASRGGEGYPLGDYDRGLKERARLARREKLAAKAEAKRQRRRVRNLNLLLDPNGPLWVVEDARAVPMEKNNG
jgi:hypothetical protein